MTPLSPTFSYNPSMNLFTIVRADIEATKGGAVLTSYSISTVRLYSVFETDFVPFQVLEVIVILFYVYYMVLEGFLIYRGGKAYLFNLGSLLHSANLVAFVLAWVCKLLAVSLVPNVEEVDPWSDTYGRGWRKGVVALLLWLLTHTPSTPAATTTFAQLLSTAPPPFTSTRSTPSWPGSSSLASWASSHAMP